VIQTPSTEQRIAVARDPRDDERAGRHIGRLGLGAPVSVRAAFDRRMGISPNEYRAVWRESASPAQTTATVRHSPPDDEAA
jgi:hypothetical protein